MSHSTMLQYTFSSQIYVYISLQQNELASDVQVFQTSNYPRR
jgi:hypothetical protein